MYAGSRLVISVNTSYESAVENSRMDEHSLLRTSGPNPSFSLFLGFGRLGTFLESDPLPQWLGVIIRCIALRSSGIGAKQGAYNELSGIRVLRSPGGCRPACLMRLPKVLFQCDAT